MPSPTSYATRRCSGIAPLQCWRWCEVVGMGAGEECGALGCWRWNSSTAAGAWTSVWGSHMLSECDHLTNLTRYHSLPHLNLESRIPSTSYSSSPSTVIGPGCGGCGRCRREIEITLDEIYSTHTTKKAGYV